MRFGCLLAVLIATVLAGEADARSRAARNEFQRHHPCPANGNSRGPCPGWQVDHITPLKCGGEDHMRNMQWLTVSDHREKTRFEAVTGCRLYR